MALHRQAQPVPKQVQHQVPWQVLGHGLPVGVAQSKASTR
jgi:uncharacterized protein YaaW (UPF0174 family)